MRKSAIQGSFICALSISAAACSADGTGTDIEIGSHEEAVSMSHGWRMASHDANASGNASEESKIGADNVGSLEVKWVFDAQKLGGLVGPVHGTPVTASNKVYFGTGLGQFFSLDRDGNLRWSYQTRVANPLMQAVFGVSNAPIVGAAVLPEADQSVIFGDLDGNIYALDRETGEELWVKAMNPHPLGGVVGNSLMYFDDTVVIGMSSFENAALGIPGYQCCTHRGFVTALDIATGEEKWRYTTIGAQQPLNGAFGELFKIGPSGADIWGQPTYDAESNTIFFGTGQNFSPKLAFAPPFSTDTSDAIIAVDATTGQEKWKKQTVAGDIWVSGLPNPNLVNPATGLPAVPFARVGWLDMDFGDSPRVYRLADGTKVVAAGQKTGEYHVFDAATGAVLSTTAHVATANSLGGFQAGGAMDGDTVFQHGLHSLVPNGNGAYVGTVRGIGLDGSPKWAFNQLLTPIAGPISTGNGVVYAVSPSDERGALDPSAPPEWALLGLDAGSGSVLLRKRFAGRALSGPIVDHGRVYVGMGNSAVPEIGMDFNGGIVALGLPE